MKAVPVSWKGGGIVRFTLGGQEVADGKPVKVALNDTVTTPVGRVVVVPSLYYGDKYFNTVVQVTKSPLQDVGASLPGRLAGYFGEQGVDDHQPGRFRMSPSRVRRM